MSSMSTWHGACDKVHKMVASKHVNDNELFSMSLNR